MKKKTFDNFNYKKSNEIMESYIKAKSYFKNFDTIRDSRENSIMFLGQVFPLSISRLGFEFGVGWTMSTFDTSDGVDGACVFKIGPAYVLPINRNFFVTTSLTFLCSAYSDDDDDWKFNPGASFAPRLGCKMGRVILTGGLDFMYMKGVDEIGTCFSVGLAMDL